jgi:hypothetical protein
MQDRRVMMVRSSRQGGLRGCLSLPDDPPKISRAIMGDIVLAGSSTVERGRIPNWTTGNNKRAIEGSLFWCLGMHRSCG